MKNILKILIISFLISCQNEQVMKTKHSVKLKDTINNIELQTTDENKIEYLPYPYDTILSGGYYLKYKLDTINLIQSLTLMKGNKEIKFLNDCSYPLLFKNLGYIGADFDSSFVFVQSYGSGNPHIIQLINKETGKILLKGHWIDANEKEQILLYIENEFEKNEKIILYDIKRKKKRIINEDLKNIDFVDRLRYCVKIDTVTPKRIILKIETKKGNILKKYNR